MHKTLKYDKQCINMVNRVKLRLNDHPITIKLAVLGLKIVLIAS